MAGTVKTTLLVGFLTFSSLAQADPPSLIRIVRNVTRHDLRDTAVQPYAESKAAVNLIGMSSVSGFSETWLAELHDSFASIEDVDNALASVGGTSARDVELGGDDVITPARTFIGLYRPGLSYRADEAAKALPKSRYLLVSVHRVRPGADADFLDLVRLRKAVSDSVNLDRPEMAYQVISGTASGTFLFLTPLPTLKLLDDALAKMPSYAEGVREAAGKKAASNPEIGLEHLLFRIDPRLSYVSDEFASGDPDFWAPKPK